MELWQVVDITPFDPNRESSEGERSKVKQEKQLDELILETLKDIYYAEKKLVRR